VAAVARRHPELKALAHRARARVAEARAAGALPAPMAMAQLWQAPLKAPFVYGEGSMLMVGIQQTFTPGSVRGAEARQSIEEARMLAAELSVRERELAAQVGAAAADLREATGLLGLHGAHRAQLSQAGAVARARQPAGGALVDLARAERELARQIAEEEGARGDEQRARGELNALLGRPADAPLALDDEAPAAPAAPLDALLTLARERSPELVVAAAALRRDTARAEATEAMGSSPMYTVGVNYGLMGPPGDAMHTWGATFAMTLPWLGRGPASLGQARADEREATRLDADAVRLRLDREISAAHARASAAARRVAAVDGRLLPAARRALDAARAGYATGASDAMSWFDAIHELREAEVTRARARGDLDRSLVELDRAVGAETPRAPLPSGAPVEAPPPAGPPAPRSTP
jgi:outer membrane protein TolC